MRNSIGIVGILLTAAVIGLLMFTTRSQPETEPSSIASKEASAPAGKRICSLKPTSPVSIDVLDFSLPGGESDTLECLVNGPAGQWTWTVHLPEGVTCSDGPLQDTGFKTAAETLSFNLTLDATPQAVGDIVCVATVEIQGARFAMSHTIHVGPELVTDHAVSPTTVNGKSYHVTELPAE